MKRLLLPLSLMLTLALTSCKKDVSDLNSAPPQGDNLKNSSQPIPFKGTMSGITAPGNGTCADAWASWHYEGDGNFTHMGKAHAILDFCMFQVDYPSPGPEFDAMMEGPGTLIAANGDQVEAYVIGKVYYIFDAASGMPVGGQLETEVLVHSGTGRFEGVHGLTSGSGTLDFTNGNTTVTLDGTIHYGSTFLEGLITGDETFVGPGNPGFCFAVEGIGFEGTLVGPVSSTLNYCNYPNYLYLPPPIDITMPVGGTQNGDVWLQDGNNELDMTYEAFMSPHYPNGPGLTAVTEGFTMGVGDITGGTNLYEGATGKFLVSNKQIWQFMIGSGPVFLENGQFYIIGWIE